MIIRGMVSADIPKGLVLCRACGWNQVAADWEALLALGRDGCVVAEVDGQVVGTLTTVAYGRRFAWIGMVLVDPASRGRGIGTALMEHALGALGAVPARLDATPAGYALYLKLGFVEESRLVRMVRETAAPSSAADLPRATTVRPMRRHDLEPVLALDRAAFGADRGELLAWALRAAPRLARVAEDGTGVCGYCFGRNGFHWSQVGPVVAGDVETGVRLVEACCSEAGGAGLVLDAAAAVPGWAERLAACGFVERRPFIRMGRGADVPAGERERQLAIFGPEWG